MDQVLQIVEQTSWGCPCLWIVIFPDGEYGYIRYRWGRLSLSLENSLNSIKSEDIGDNLDGVISFFDMEYHLNEWGYELKWK